VRKEIFSDPMSKWRSLRRQWGVHGNGPCDPFSRIRKSEMKFALMIYETSEAFAERTGKDAAAYLASWMAYADTLRKAGVHVGGSGLEPPCSGTSTLRFGKDGRSVQDGPYADTKEQLGGFFLIDVPDLDAALEWAARLPMKGGAVEVRPVLGACQATSNNATPALATASA
jgi:hypothetical protein